MMIENLTPSEAKSAIEERLQGHANVWWCGASPDLTNEFIVVAQRRGVDVAVAEIEAYLSDDEE